MNSGAKTTTQINELIYGFGGTTTGGVTSGLTFTTRAAADTQAAADKTVASIGSYSYDATFAGTRTWVAHMATFKGGQSQSGLGFTPAAVFFASVMDITRTVAVAESRIGFGASDGTTEFTSSMQDQDAVTTSRVRNFERSTKAFSKVNNNTSTVDAEANVLGFNTDGFALNWTTNDAVATEILYVAFAPLWLSEVRLIPASFQATRYPSGVLVAWKTGYEVDNLGFDLYRELNGDRIKVNTAPIKGTGLQAGNGGIVNSEHSYARWDMDADGADPNVVDPQSGNTPLFTVNNDPEMVRALVDGGADVDRRQSNGTSPVVEFISTRQWESALYLIEKGANLGLVNEHGVSVDYFLNEWKDSVYGEHPEGWDRVRAAIAARRR